MRICVPTESDQGLDAPVSSHFGRAPFFAFVDSESKQVEFVANRETDHERGRCRGASLAAQHRPDAVAAAGMGQGAYDMLRKRGAHIYLCREARLEDAVDAVVAGTSRELSDGEAMGHHHAGAAHAHHHGHGQGGCCGDGSEDGPAHHGRGHHGSGHGGARGE